MDCPARWKAQNLLEIRMPTSGAAWVGTSIHYGTAQYDLSRLSDTPISIEDAVGHMVDMLHHEKEEVDWDEMRIDKIEPIAKTLIVRYCGTISQFREYLGVELRCEDLDLRVPEHDITIRITGTPDRIRKDPDGRIGVSDIKTGARAVGSDGCAVTQGHGLQLGIYELLAEHAMGLPIEAPAEVIGLQTSKEARVGTAEVPNARAALLGTEAQPGIIEIAARMLAHDIFPGNPRSMLCGSKYCPIHSTCIYRG